ncbi:MAG TPA: DUF1810 domain-containing protein [Bacteroidota bacterium]|nr:DUF1810 domain-containing protein [Bacteroidota bacterium]
MNMSNDHHDIPDLFGLDRFLEAQQSVYRNVVMELSAGEKRTHWMWFIFPQLHGLGSSLTSRYYAIKSLQEARAYLEHPILGPRLFECTALVQAHAERTPREIFGFPDDMKFLSSMTLFELADNRRTEFAQAIDTFYQSRRDVRTLELALKTSRPL